MILKILIGALAVRLITALLNPGFASFDDYQSVIRLIIPAQNIPGIEWIISESELRSPLVRLFLFPLTKLASTAGVLDPLWQLRICYAFLALLTTSTVWAGYKIFRGLNRDREALWAAGIIGFHCFLPYLNTRVMFENLAMTPFVWSVYFMQKSLLQRNPYKEIFWSVILLALACIARPQLGVCILVILGIGVHKKSPLAFVSFLASSALSFFSIGYADQYLRGEFHASLKAYYHYNITYGHTYGSYPFYYYLPVLLGLGGMILLFDRWRNFSWRQTFFPLMPTVASIAVVLLSHSYHPYKEERFLFPLIPLIGILMAPLMFWLWEKGKTLRLKILFALNFLLMFLIAPFPAQWNVVGLVHSLGSLPFAKLYAYKESVGMFPAAYSVKALEVPSKIETLQKLDCDEALIVREDYRLELTPQEWDTLKLVAEFKPGPIEALAVKLNPRKNKRRDSLGLYQSIDCP